MRYTYMSITQHLKQHLKQCLKYPDRGKNQPEYDRRYGQCLRFL